MFAPKPIKPIKPIKRESTRAREKENSDSHLSRSQAARKNRTEVRTSVLSSSYDPTEDEQARILAYAAGVDLLTAFDAFKDYYAATGKHLTDWGAKFRLWLRREKNFNPTAQATATSVPAQARPAARVTAVSKAANFATTTGVFADNTRRILNDAALKLTLEQKKKLFPQAIDIMINTQDAESVRSFVKEQIA